MTSETNTFSTSGEEAIKRTIDVQIDETADHLSAEAFDEFYDIDRTAREIEEGDYKQVALQFPDELLHDSVSIFRKLKRKIGAQHEVAAQHVDANAMVHYGYACLSQTYRLPVIYVFGRKTLDLDDCVSKLFEVFTASASDESPRTKTIVLRHDVVYTHLAGKYGHLSACLSSNRGCTDALLEKLRDRVKPLGTEVQYSSIPDKILPPQTDSATRTQPLHQLHRRSEDLVQDCTIFYIGDENLGLTNLLMTHSTCDVFSYSPTNKTAQLQSIRTNKMLMRRYAVVQKARDADVFGILVGTLGVASYLPLIKHIRAILASAKKKSYTISVGKLNPSKLANFMEIECFVLVACPENSLIDAKDFYRPIVTPFELEVALQSEPNWTGRYVLDFEQLLAENPLLPDDKESGGDDAQAEEEDGDDDRPIFSLVTGKYRHAKRYGAGAGTDTEVRPAENDSSSALIPRKDQNGALVKVADDAAGQFLQSRTYQGLEMRLGEDAPSVLEQGRSGIARGYGET